MEVKRAIADEDAFIAEYGNLSIGLRTVESDRQLALIRVVLGADFEGTIVDEDVVRVKGLR